ncbi:MULTISPECIES: flagellar biosynthesis protein FlhB [Niallia]|jgi:flagellar biosynthesis protein FlhB|uniref:Flagellar biosynthetic protein FlhB n=1 Tax=Niallia circulans TaxID=1397 RepID=A0A268FFW2_NIACI|nr:flagellar biosynthesis protein FlhB [Niallia circulans]AYV66027.1 flagellar biosynthesis protein FlhB [Niallia circulans]AYV71155.1 flagellar biosynthesis protein FlhB [Niallia circulans]NRG29134.1 flagellar biosynthesis protein FlhB [Niallia circulans]PAD84254.1 flagellar biosynthesis protein FlhB [Niallia circulans]QJX61921.1 flagellar biosynthesis protein FlhB [Niallia circulans]
MKLLSLDLQFFAGEKTEKATPKKRQDTRKKGQVAKSQDVNTALVLLVVFGVLSFTGEYLLDGLLSLFTFTFSDFMGINLSINSIQGLFLDILKEVALLLSPILIAALAGGLIANYMQVGVLFSPEAIKFKLEKINPISGFKRLFSLRSIVELLKSLLKITVIGIVVFSVLWGKMNEILILSHKSIGSIAVTIAKLTVQMGLYASIALLVIALMDYMYQRYDYEKNIRMSKQDIKDEYKNMEGDPLIKSKIKQKQREMAMHRMMQDVPTADVVITNPTHYAICLKYDEDKYDAPYVVAKGVDFVAQKIKLVAKENNVVMVENRPLARAMYSQVEIGDLVPEEFYKAVAEILAFVYQTRDK